MKSLFFYLGIFFCLALGTGTGFCRIEAKPLKVHVLSKENLQQAKISSFAIRYFAGNQSGQIQGSVTLRAAQGKVEILDPPLGAFSKIRFISENAGLGMLELDGASGGKRRFTGALQVEVRGGALFFIEEIPLEDYVRGVLPAEMPADFPLEAQKAQAVLARTYARAAAPRHAAEGFDFCDLTHCQAYRAVAPLSAAQEEAWRATRSLVLSSGGRPIEALFHSTCGGHTSPNQKVFGGPARSYLQGVSDGEYCRASPHWIWEARIDKTALSRLFGADSKKNPGGILQNILPADREAQGRIFTLILQGERPVTLPAMEFLSAAGKALGWNRIKSNWFEVTLSGEDFIFQGRGLGHGVGLCQWGARGMAEAGKKFDEILRHYFPGTRLMRQTSGGI
ncbi:MAG TPA: hypothetical protein DF383_10115 [Deltaproteobacteria bacterium]|nr:hypothetical protein [Deltaproteobacteria bacterium]